MDYKKSISCVLGGVLIVLSSQDYVQAKEKSFPLAIDYKVNWVNYNGKVTDSNGEPLIGVTIMVKGSKSGTTTDINGNFSINVPTGSVLVISYLGFETTEILVGANTTLNIKLNQSQTTLQEVVVSTGYGEKKRSEIVGAVATITGEELMDIPAPNIAGALRNRIAGLSVDQVSGRPGASISLNIRGASAANTPVVGSTAEPLYIIDGITVDGEAFDNLDASMVESISILKDASAAIYGAAGAKGVVLVTTKRGKQGKPSITYNGYVGVSDAAKVPDMLSAYEHALLLNDKYKLSNDPASNFFSPTDLEYLRSSNITSWYDELWKASTMQRHNVSISGGSDKITFFAGGSYQNENGNYKGLKQDKYTFRSGMNATILPGLTADVAFNVDHRINESNSSLNQENDAGFFESIITVPRWVPISINGLPVNYNDNPLANLNSGFYDRRKTQGYRVNASLSYKPEFLKGLTARVQVSQGGGLNNDTRYTAPYDVYNFQMFGNAGQFYTDQLLDPSVGPQSEAAVSANNSEARAFLQRNNSWQGFFTLQYGSTFGAHSVNLIAGGEQTVSDRDLLGNVWVGQLVPGVDDPWGFDVNRTQQPVRTIFESTKRSFFSRFSYDFDKKYLFEAVARLDASSNFASGNRWGLSPSIGAGWVISQEDFFKNNVNFVNFLKFKVNYGITGDDRVGERLWQERYKISLNDGYLFGDNNGIGLNPAVFPNLDITWEKKQTINTGIEASLFNNKFDIGVEFFRNYGYDGFDGGVNQIYPMYAGFAAAVVNYREVYNWGSEFTLGYKAKLAKDLNLNASMNFGYGNSVVDKQIYNPNELYFNTPEDWVLVGTDPRVYNNNNLGLRSRGIFKSQAEVDAFMAENPNYTIRGNVPEPGWLYYEDTDGDGVITESDMVPLFNHPQPIFSSGITLGLNYKNFNLNTNIFARFGGKVYYDSRARESPTVSQNVLDFWTDRWSPTNPDGKFPRGDDPSIGIESDFWAVDNTTIRVNNMTLSYKLPSKLANKFGMGGARILATGNNLWTIVNPLKYKDPETNSAYDYPTIRTISLGLSVNL